MKSTAAYIDNEYGRLMKKVRKCNGQLSDVTKAINTTQVHLTESRANFTEALTELQTTQHNGQVKLSEEVKGTEVYFYSNLI